MSRVTQARATDCRTGLRATGRLALSLLAASAVLAARASAVAPAPVVYSLALPQDQVVQLQAQDPATLAAQSLSVPAITLPYGWDFYPGHIESAFNPVSDDYSFIVDHYRRSCILYCQNVRDGEVHETTLARLPIGLEADPASGLLYGCWSDGGPRGVPSLYSLDPHTGRASLVARLDPPRRGGPFTPRPMRLLSEVEAHAFDPRLGDYYCYLVPADFPWWFGQDIRQPPILCAVNVASGRVRYVRADRLMGLTTFDPMSRQIVGVGVGRERVRMARAGITELGAVFIQSPATGRTRYTYSTGDPFDLILLQGAFFLFDPVTREWMYFDQSGGVDAVNVETGARRRILVPPRVLMLLGPHIDPGPASG